MTKRQEPNHISVVDVAFNVAFGLIGVLAGFIAILLLWPVGLGAVMYTMSNTVSNAVDEGTLSGAGFITFFFAASIAWLVLIISLL